jgi:hypothetical protein
MSGFDELIAVLRRGPSDISPEVPPPSLWAAIEAGLSGEATDPTGPAPVADLGDWRRRRKGRIALAVAGVAALFLVAVPAGLALRGSSPTPIEKAQLAALGGFNGSGQAELAGRELEVDTTGLTPVEGEFYELWLLDLEGGEVKDLVSLGTIDADGRYRIADNIDLRRYHVVDISLEPDDGNPSHSGDSVLRGELGPAT